MTLNKYSSARSTVRFQLSPTWEAFHQVLFDIRKHAITVNIYSSAWSTVHWKVRQNEGTCFCIQSCALSPVITTGGGWRMEYHTNYKYVYSVIRMHTTDIPPFTTVVLSFFMYSEYHPRILYSRLWKNITINHAGISNLKWRLTRIVHELQCSFKLTQELRYGAAITQGVFGAAV